METTGRPNTPSTETTLPVPTEAEPLEERSPWRAAERQVSGFVRRIAEALDFWSGSTQRSAVPGMEQISDWCREAWEKRGKIAGLMAIAKVADAYRNLDDAGKDAFFQLLYDEFSVDETELQAAMAAYGVQAPPAAEGDGADGHGPDGHGTPGNAAAADHAAALVRLSRALESPRLALFEQFNTIPQGIKFLVDLRADLTARLRKDPALAPLEYELHRKLASFFNLGFLQLVRIGWDSPAQLLENLIRYEAVNHISNWDDLKHRLISDRACFAFLHPAMPHEPVIFVEVALVRGLADNIQRLLDPTAPDLHPDQADTAIFYGISNAQQGLRGIQFGNLLIKQVVTRLRSEVANLKTFATLSPLPRLRKDFLLPSIEDGSIAEFFEKDEAARVRHVAQSEDTAAAVGELLAEPEWHRNPDAAEALRPGLLRATRHYLTERQRDDHAACPVAHFHGSNGALLARVNWLGDTSANGMKQSAGIMVNYLYDLSQFEKHQSDYMRTGHIAIGKEVKAL